ncbi:MAG: acetyl-CoA carboxylase biotin carboxyl carrier protein [Bacteroidota bacterium]
MTYKEMLDLIKTVNRLELTEFKLKDGDLKITIRTKGYTKATPTQISSVAAPTIMPVPQAIPAAVPATAPAAAPTEETVSPAAPQESSGESTAPANYLEIKSPIVGTFYRSSSPDKPPFVKVGDSVKSGDVVCIVEAMKLFNEIESEISGKIVKVMVEDRQPVEYDQVLFLVEA